MTKLRTRTPCCPHAQQKTVRKNDEFISLLYNPVAEVFSEGMEVDQKTLFNIALGVSSTLECEALAACLDVDERLVKSLKDRNKEPREIALEVLKTWAKRKKATPWKLYDALHDCKLDSLQVLIEKFRDQLCRDPGRFLKSC